MVGVIANLGLIFAAAVLWPQGWHAAPDWRALGLCLAALLALLSARVGPMVAMLACGLAGLLLA